ncbi:MAG: glycoside hydrolase family 2 protein [Bacteroidia bacterium]|nr:MAG: glycoside hydrolase family 2 protein [Bacteroidia bacterium]
MEIQIPRIIFFVLILFPQFLSAQRETTLLDKGWKFYKGASESAYLEDFDDSGWREVTVPHDWAIGEPFIKDGDANTGKLPWKGEGWYRKTISMDPDYREKKLYLMFDGVMAFPEVYVNGKLAGRWDYGYNSFWIDITGFVNFDKENIIAVHADTRNHDSRWYPGAGIYRKVQLIAVNQVHVAPWGTYITTPLFNPHYTNINVAITINNYASADEEIRVKNSIISAEGIKVAGDEFEETFTGGAVTSVELTMTLGSPQKWDVENPYLYTLVTEIFRDNRLLDSYNSTFGVRDISFTADDGFWLNGRRLQLRGVNLHHDQGPLGAAFNTRAMERQLEIMKSMGCNAVRNSHNVAAPELLELCDRMGILVFNEIFDKYDGKADISDTTDFEEFAARNIRNFVMRDRNHPSVFIWSVGNEIGDVQWNINDGFRRLQTMIKYVNMYDTTRFTTLVCDNYESARLRHFDYYDVHSWNYGRRYSLARELEPGKSVIISESASTVSTRGFYEFPLPASKTDFTNSLQVSSYDLNAPEWAEISDDDFMWQQDEPYVAGEFVWTGFDYLGEPTPYTNQWVKAAGMTDTEASRSSYFGIVDLCGIPKDRYWLYKSYWKPEETTVHILPHWNWEERAGENVPVFVYTNGDCAELFLNGESLGKRCKDPGSSTSVERFRLIWNDVIYRPGELKAVAYKDGQKIGEQVIKTAAEPYSLRLTPDRDKIKPGGSDLSYILVEVIDKDGTLCPLADDNVEIMIKGAGSVAGVGNGNPQSFHPFKSDNVDLFYGKAMIIVAPGSKAGKLTIEVSSPGINGIKTDIEVR